MREQLTKSDVKKIEEEIEYRRLVLRKELIESVKEARAQGDLSENFEYHAAKKEKNKNESRIRYLERMLKTASVISDESKMDEVGLNNRVTVYFEDDDEEEVYKLVTSVRGNSLKNYISIESPIGKATAEPRSVTACMSRSMRMPATIWRFVPLRSLMMKRRIVSGSIKCEKQSRRGMRIIASSPFYHVTGIFLISKFFSD